MKAKTKVGKITGGVLAGILSCGALSSPLSIQAVKLENINIETQNKEIKVKVYEDINGKIKIQLRSDKDVSDVDLKLTIDKNKILTYKYKKIFAGETIEFEIDDSDLENAVSKILPKTSSVRKNIFFMGTTKNHIVSGNISYSVEEELEKPEVPKKPEKPETKPKTLKDSGTPEVKPETPKESETPEAKPEVPKEPEHPEVKPEMPKEPGTPETKPETPKDSGTPEVKPEVPKESEQPEATPEMPKEPGIPEDKPETPKDLGTPEVKPEIPKEPEQPEVKPETPKESEHPEATPETPKEPEHPEVKPETPKEPEQPKVSEEKEETEIALLIQSSNNFPIMDKLTYEIVSEEDKTDRQEVVSEDGMLREVGVYKNTIYVLKLKDNKKYEMAPIRFIVDNNNGVAKRVDTKADIIELPLTKKEVSPQLLKEETQVSLLIQSNNGRPVLDKLEYVIVSEEDETDRQEVVSENGMLREVGVYKNTIYVLKLKDNKKYEMPPIRFIVNNDYEVARKVEVDEDITEIKLIKKQEQENNKENKTVDTLRVVVKKDNKVIPNSQVRLLKRELGIPNIISTVYTNENGEVNFTNLDPSSDYEVLMTNKEYNFSEDRYKFTTDSSGKLKVDNLVSVSNNIATVEFNAYSKGSSEPENATVTFKVINKETGDAVEGVELSVSVLQPKLGTYKKGVSNKDGNVVFTLIGQENGKNYAVTVSKNAQFLWRFEPSDISFTVDENGVIKYDNNAQPIIKVTPDNREHLKSDLQSKIVEVEKLLEKIYTNEAAVNNLRTILAGAKAELEKIETVPYYVEELLININKSIEEVKKYQDNSNEIVTIEDKLLKKVINKNINKDRAGDEDITRGELSKLTKLSIFLNNNGEADIEGNTIDILGTPKNLSGTKDFKFAVSRGIKSLSGLEYATNLEYLKLNENEISELLPLANLTKLKYIELQRNRIKNVEALANLTKLEYLKLYNNLIEDISPLKNLTKLTGLDVHYNVTVEGTEDNKIISKGITDVSVISNMPNLRYLDVSANRIEDISVIKNLNKLEDIDFSGNNIKDYTGLSNYIADKLEKSLNEGEGSIGFASQKVNYNKEINVNSNNFNIESPFLGMEDLSRELSEKFEADVNLFANVETNIEGLSAKYNKETRTLEFTASDKFLKDHNGRTVPVNVKLSYDEYAWQVQNINLHINDSREDIIEFKDENLKNFILNKLHNYTGDEVSDIPGEYELKMIDPDYRKNQEDMKIYRGDLEKIVAFAIRGYDLEYNDLVGDKQIKDLSGLEYAKNLKQLTISGNSEDSSLGLRSVEPLKNLPNLELLRLSHNALENISQLSNLVTLKKLYLSHNNISDISSLSVLKNLEELDVAVNKLNDIDIIKNFKNLKVLTLRNNNIADLSSVAELTNLTTLDINNNKIENIENLRALTNLEVLYLENNLLRNVDTVNQLIKLKDLNLKGNKIEELNLENLSKLRELNIANNKLNELSSISNLILLNKLYASNNKIENINFASNLENLEIINVDNNKIFDFTPIKNLKKLYEVGIDNQELDYNTTLNVTDKSFSINSPFINFKKYAKDTINAVVDNSDISAIYDLNNDKIIFTASEEFLQQHNEPVPINVKITFVDKNSYDEKNISLNIKNISLNVVRDNEVITEFSTRQKFIKAKGGALLATLKGENLVKEDISFDVFANDEKVDNVSYETQGFWDNNEVNYIFSIPENNTNREIEYKIKPKVKNKVIDSLGLEITQKKKEEVKKLNLAPKGIYFNEDNSVIEVVFDKNISNAKENLEELKKTIKLSKGQANENFTPYKKLMDTDRVSISENKIIINLTESIPAEEAIFCRLKIDEAAIKDNDNNYSEEIALFINSHKEAKKSKITDYNIKNPILLLNGGIVEVDIIGENLNNPKIKIIDSNKAEINTELTDSITYEKVGEKIIARINLPANTTNSTKSYVVTFIQEDGSIFNRYLKDGSNRGDRPALSVLSEGKLLTDTTLSNVNISSYATNGGGSSDNNLNLTHTVTSKGQNSKKTESHIYGTNLSETKTKVKIVDQNGVEWPIFVSGSSLTGVYPKMVIPGNSKVGNGIVGDGNHQLAEIILPDELDRDMLYTYYFAVDGENYDYTKPVTALVEKTKGQVSAEKRTIIVKYQDEAGKELKDAKELTGYSWFNYSVSKDNIENYQFLNVKDNKELSGEFGTEDKEIVLVYKEKVSEDLADEGYKQELNNEINEKLSKNEKFQAADTDKKGQYATIRTEARQVAADKQATKSQVNEVVLKLKEAKKEVLLSGAKNLAKDTIDNLQNIDKTHYKELIDSASNSEEVEKFLQEAREQSKKEKESITEFTSKQNIIKNTGGYYRATVKGSGLKPEDISFTIKKDNIKVSDIAYEVQSSSETEVNYLFNIPFNEDSVEHSYKLIAKLKGEVVPLSALTFTIQAKEQMLEMSARVKDFYFELFNDYSKFDKKYKRLTDEANLKYNLVKKPKTDKNFTEKDFEMLKEFHIVKNNIDDELVAPLKFAKNLEVFSVLQNNKNLTRTVTDFSFLKNTPKLKQFYYSNQDPESKEKISLPEIDFSTNTALEDVRITKTDLGNLDLISERNLKSLSVEDNNISDISALENMTILTRLDLDNNKVTDVSNLSTLTGLKTLYLRENPISNISSLEPLKNLEALHLKGTNISDISVIEQLPNLHRLVIENNSHLENYMDTIKRKNSLNVVYVDKISKDDYEWLKQFSIRDSVDATENEDKVRDYSFRKLPLIINVESGSINNGEVTIDNPLQDWNGEKVIPEEVPENVRFEGDKIIIISNVESNKKIAYKIYLENYENMYGEYSQPATIQGTVEITLNVVENSSTDKELPSRV